MTDSHAPDLPGPPQAPTAPARAFPEPGTMSLAPPPRPERVVRAVTAARDWLLARQQAAGFWCAELEGDTTLESYLILLEAFFGRPGSEKSIALGRVIRAEMLPDGGWA